ncbi:hypothetical protein JKP88DRAFT_245989 [Tribonema minus]|uniref:Uncharacterized protein n=1 Tax=Tribonema minus TaxID=303371 RepID=A0A835YVQ4_9STRA|nr:hypothetical protein JKP88DRAFT_245989 [Tribonema minus]
MAFCQPCYALRRHHLPQIDRYAEGLSDVHGEAELREWLKQHLQQLGCEVLAEEWDVVPGMPNCGVGDLVVELPCGTHLVTEIKFLDFYAHGNTATVKRRKHRREVEQQACRYGSLWAKQYRGVAVGMKKWRALSLYCLRETAGAAMEKCHKPVKMAYCRHCSALRRDHLPLIERHADGLRSVYGEEALCMQQFGVGDLVSKLPCGTHLVTEIKFLDFFAHGSTAKVKRRKHRREVEQQDFKYGAHWAQQHAGTLVVCAVFTNEGLQFQGSKQCPCYGAS